MSERDDDEYLWSGRGPASGDVQQLEKIFGGEKLRAPLDARPRRRIPLSIAVAILTALTAYVLTHKNWLPSSWVAAVLPGVSAEEVEGSVWKLSVADENPPAGWQQPVEQRIRQRSAPHSIRFEGRRVIVDYALGGPGELRDELGRRGDFAIQEVIESSPLMRAIYTRISEGDELAEELGVTAEIDSWEHDESGRRFTDWYLRAASPQVLDAYLRAVQVENPRLAPDAAHMFAFGQEWHDPDDPEPARWRSYYLDRTVWLSNADIANAYVYWNRTTNRPEVLVEYSAEGGNRFADLTGRITGRKLAILFDGQVSSAPVVQDRITGGRTTITMSGDNAREVQQEAQDLVAALRAGQNPLPVGLHEDELTFRSDRLSDTDMEIARAVIAFLFGLLIFVSVYLAERWSPGVDPDVAPVRGRRRRRAVPWIRLAVSAAAVVIAILAERIPIPGDIDWEQLQGFRISMFALGIMPAISAFLLVELAAVMVPSWRRLQAGGPSARARLGSATAILTLVLAVVQAWFIADFLLSIDAFAHLSRWMLVLSFTAGAVVMTVLALLVSQYGLGNGFAVLLLVGLGKAAWRVVRSYRELEAFADTPWGFTQFYLVIAVLTATAVATAWILRRQVRGSSAASSLRLPTAGIVPLAILPSLLALFAVVWPEMAGRVGVWWQDNVFQRGSGLLVELGALIVLGAILSWLFSRPARLGGATAGRARPYGYLVGTAVSIAYLVVVALLDRWAADELRYFGISLVWVVLGTAVAMDLLAEWRAFARRDDLVPIWPLHQVQRVELVTGALARNGIDVHARGLYLRLLLHFFGPFVPVLLYVPADRAEEARAIVAAQLGVK
jgi:hypothetical protein